MNDHRLGIVRASRWSREVTGRCHIPGASSRPDRLFDLRAA
ncbi:hypothetical protein [Geminicoccus harenae]|nr:hypothetical protein [Geminicoccus harenae]